MPKRTYGREKREKELNRQRKREEKEQRKIARAAARTDNPDTGELSASDTPPAGE